MSDVKYIAFQDLGDGSQAEELKGFLASVGILSEVKKGKVKIDDDIVVETYLCVEKESDLPSASIMGSVYAAENELDDILEFFVTGGLGLTGTLSWVREYNETGKVSEMEDYVKEINQKDK